MEQNEVTDLEKLLSLTDKELKSIFYQLSLTEIEGLLDKLNEVDYND